MKREVLSRWWMLAGVAAALSGACGDDSSGGDEEKDCPTGSEACPCYRDDTCDDDLVCLSDLCVYDPDASPNGSGGRRPNTMPGEAGDGSDPEAGTSSGGRSNAGQGGTGNSGSGADGGDTQSTGGGSAPRGGGSGTGGNPSGPTPVERYGALSVNGTRLLDAAGNRVKLEGMSSMWLNWEPTGYALNRDALFWMRDNWNLRLFRIAMGAYHEDDLENTYLANPEQNKAWVNTIVQNAIDAGVYVIIDWHDHEALSHQAEASAFFDEMSAKWGDYPNVIYELFNEPLDVNWSTQLKPYYQSLISTIRANDPDNLIILGTPNWDQDVDIAASDPVSGTNLMYTLHFYACTHTANLRSRAKSALVAGLPLFVTEWGSTHADGGVDGLVCEAETRAWHDWMDQEYISWAAWKLDGCTDSTCMFKDKTAPVDGGWTNDMLNGHAPLVIDEMKNGPMGAGGSSSGTGGGPGTGGSGPGTGGSGTGGGGTGIDLSEKPEGCAIVTTCPSCCVTSAVFALDSADPPNDMTEAYVTAWSASSTQATATFDFQTYDEVGAILFKFASLQTVSALGVDAGTINAPLEVAFVKDAGATGCIYIEDTFDGWISNGCWGDPDGTFDQIEVRARSIQSGPVTLDVRQIVYE